MSKKAYFYIDDVIWPFRDIMEERPKSIFDQRLLKILKEAHEIYGLKVTLNCFYRTDYSYSDYEFSLAEMTDVYKSEWEENSDWLKLGYHAKQEFPDYPLINVEYDDMKNEYMRFVKEVKRFAGENILMESINPHWWPVSKDGCRALRDCGIKLFSCTYGTVKDYNGDPASLPYGHAFRLMQNRKPESMLFFREGRDTAVSNSLCAYNHLNEDEANEIHGTFKTIYNEELGIHFKKFGNGICLNTTPLDEIKKDMMTCVNSEYVCCATHEQYAYPEYFAYQPETKEKLFEMCRVFKENGYEYFFVDECLEF
ncbi:MAG: hypothetical protein E7393_00525 [Ruminococcaceae bacterium]|nr:hypothetical protein [Oscillospiraceae bacterium]